jgi:hypothetical protein
MTIPELDVESGMMWMVDADWAMRIMQMPHRTVQSISPTIGIWCSPGPWQLRHRGDVEQGPASAPTLLMT